MLRKTVSFIFAAVFFCTAAISAAAYENAYPLPDMTGMNNIEKIISVADSQIGYKEDSEGRTAYTEEIGESGSAWCSEFVAWCARRSGIPETVIPNGTSVNKYRRFYSGIGRYYTIAGRQYTSDISALSAGSISDVSEIRSGDILFTVTDRTNPLADSNHTALCIGVSGGYIYTIDGNTNDMVMSRKRTLSDIHSFARPAYGCTYVHSGTPDGLKSVIQGNSVVLSWNKVPAAEKYSVQYYSDAGWTTIGNPLLSSFTVSGLREGGKYVYRVLAYSLGSYGIPSEKLLVTVPSSVPQNVRAEAGNKSVVLEWTAVSNAIKYRVQHYTNGGWKTVSYPKTPSCTINGLKNGGKYVYRVLAYVNGSWSRPSAKIMAVPYDSTRPEILKTTVSGSSVVLQWSAVSNTVKYRLQHYTDGGWKTIAYPKSTSCSVNGLKTGGKYVYRVVAYANGSWGMPSEKVLIIPQL